MPEPTPSGPSATDHGDSFRGRTAIVTGATRGIGRALARALAERGARVAFNYLSNEDLAASLSAEIAEAGGEARAFRADAADHEAVGEMVKRVKDELGTPTLLVNNAGLTRDKLLMMMKTEDWQRVLDVDLSGPFHFCRHVVPLMVKARTGAIVNVSSVSGLVGLPGQVNYSAAKAGLVGMTRALAKEIGKRNVRVNAVALGFVATDMTDALGADYRERIIERIALGRLAAPADVVDPILFLLSDAARYVTGECLRIDGGLSV